MTSELFVQKTIKNKSSFIYFDEDYIYNTVTQQKSKNRNSSKINLNNEKALDQRLYTNPKNLRLVVIPSWSCNLRCPYCFVLKKLQKDFKSYDLDFNKLDVFIKMHKEKYNHNDTSIFLIGGEPLLFPNFGLEIAKIAKSNSAKFCVTTNLSMNMTAECKELISQFDKLQISIDGPEKIHNKYRKILNSENNPTKKNENIFKNVIKNLMEVLNFVPSEKIVVSASLIKNKTEDMKDLEELVFILKSIGIKNIKIGYVAPSDYFQ